MSVITDKAFDAGYYNLDNLPLGISNFLTHINKENMIIKYNHTDVPNVKINGVSFGKYNEFKNFFNIEIGNIYKFIQTRRLVYSEKYDVLCNLHFINNKYYISPVFNEETFRRINQYKIYFNKQQKPEGMSVLNETELDMWFKACIDYNNLINEMDNSQNILKEFDKIKNYVSEYKLVDKNIQFKTSFFEGTLSKNETTNEVNLDVTFTGNYDDFVKIHEIIE